MSFERRDIVDIRRQPDEDIYDHRVRAIGILTHFWFEFLQWAIIVGGLGYLAIATRAFFLMLIIALSEFLLLAYCLTFGARFECDSFLGHEFGRKVTSLIIGALTAIVINATAVAIYFAIYIAKGLPA